METQVESLCVFTHNGKPVSQGGLRRGNAPYGIPGVCVFYRGAMISWPWTKQPEPKPVRKEELVKRARIDYGGDVSCPHCHRYNFGVADPGSYRVPDMTVRCRDCGMKFTAFRPSAI